MSIGPITRFVISCRAYDSLAFNGSNQWPISLTVGPRHLSIEFKAKAYPQPPSPYICDACLYKRKSFVNSKPEKSSPDTARPARRVMEGLRRRNWIGQLEGELG